MVILFTVFYVILLFQFSSFFPYYRSSSVNPSSYFACINCMLEGAVDSSLAWSVSGGDFYDYLVGYLDDLSSHYPVLVSVESFNLSVGEGLVEGFVRFHIYDFKFRSEYFFDCSSSLGLSVISCVVSSSPLPSFRSVRLEVDVLGVDDQVFDVLNFSISYSFDGVRVDFSPIVLFEGHGNYLLSFVVPLSATDFVVSVGDLRGVMCCVSFDL